MSSAQRQAILGEAASTAAAPAAVWDTPFSCLPDDVLGIVYEQLDWDSRRSFRHACAATYRSRSINAQITSVTIGADGVEAIALQDFPKNATLRTLGVLSASTWQGQMVLLKEAQSLQDASDCLRLSSVNKIKLIGMADSDSLLSGQAARTLLDLFPQLATGQVTLEICDVHIMPSFFMDLEEKAHGLRSLRLWECIGIRGIIRLLGRLKELRRLTLSVDDEVEAESLASLAALQQLTKLKLQHVSILGGGLNNLLSLLPNLQSLSLHWVSFKAPVLLSSSSLRTLVLEAALPSEMDRASLPVLQRVELRSLFVVDVAGRGVSGDVLVSRLARVSSMLAAFPVHVSSFFYLGCPPDMSARSSVMLQALMPLKQAFASVTELSLMNMNCGPSGSSKLSDLFPHLRYLLLDGSGLDEAFSGLLVALERLKGLEVLSVTTSSIPNETFAVLLAAGREGRRFTLSLTPTTEDCEVDSIKLLSMWAPAQHMLPSITLIA